MNARVYANSRASTTDRVLRINEDRCMPPASTSPIRSRWRAIAFISVEAWWWLVSLFYLCAALAVAPFLLLGVGWLAVPTLVEWLDHLAARARERSARYARTVAPPHESTAHGSLSFRDRVALLTTPEFRRNAAWLLGHLLLVPLVVVLGLGLPLAAVNGLTSAAAWWAMPLDDPQYAPFAVTSWPLAAAAFAIAVACGLLAWVLLPWLARRTAASTLSVLWPDRHADLQQQVESLSRSRAAALDAHSSELRRIERELHDGAQNRLVGVVMMIGLAQRSLETNPDAVASYLTKAQDAASDALTGLREMVHDIYPPVLDELGLGGAASTLTSRSGVPCTLDVSRLRRAPAAVESAAYFVLAEALTNAAKYAQASNVAVTLSTESSGAEETVVVHVEDDGIGGAVVGGSGTGLAGVARRAEALGGTLAVASPIGGPTALRVELPCGF